MDHGLNSSTPSLISTMSTFTTSSNSSNEIELVGAPPSQASVVSENLRHKKQKAQEIELMKERIDQEQQYYLQLLQQISSAKLRMEQRRKALAYQTLTSSTSGWQEVKTESGEVYYWNYSTRQASKIKPDCLVQLGLSPKPIFPSRVSPKIRRHWFFFFFFPFQKKKKIFN